jgi:hypothetical protein
MSSHHSNSNFVGRPSDQSDNQSISRSTAQNLPINTAARTHQASHGSSVYIPVAQHDASQVTGCTGDYNGTLSGITLFETDEDYEDSRRTTSSNFSHTGGTPSWASLVPQSSTASTDGGQPAGSLGQLASYNSLHNLAPRHGYGIPMTWNSPQSRSQVGGEAATHANTTWTYPDSAVFPMSMPRGHSVSPVFSSNSTYSAIPTQSAPVGNAAGGSGVGTGIEYVRSRQTYGSYASGQSGSSAQFVAASNTAGGSRLGPSIDHSRSRVAYGSYASSQPAYRCPYHVHGCPYVCQTVEELGQHNRRCHTPHY